MSFMQQNCVPVMKVLNRMLSFLSTLLLWGRGGRVVRCRIAMLEVVGSNPGRGKINLEKVMGSDGKL